MNSLFIPTLSTNATQITGASTPFSIAIFYPVSGFGAQGAPVYNTGALYLANVSGNAPITIAAPVLATVPNSGTTWKSVLTYTVNSLSSQQENLNKYFITAQSALNTDGVYVLYV